MSHSKPTKPSIASKWNARYAFANQARPAPADVLLNAAGFLPKSGLAVDIACGRGGNAFHLLECGLSVTAWDISKTAIDSVRREAKDAKRPLVAEVRDVVADPPLPNSFDVIVVSRFLDRALCANLSAALRPNGVLFYQTFTAGLTNPDYLLKPNELPDLFADLVPCFRHESAVNKQDFSEAQFVGRKG